MHSVSLSPVISLTSSLVTGPFNPFAIYVTILVSVASPPELSVPFKSFATAPVRLKSNPAITACEVSTVSSPVLTIWYPEPFRLATEAEAAVIVKDTSCKLPSAFVFTFKPPSGKVTVVVFSSGFAEVVSVATTEAVILTVSVVSLTSTSLLFSSFTVVVLDFTTILSSVVAVACLVNVS